MAVVRIPKDMHVAGTVCCELCAKHISLAQATVGPQSSDHRQTFACNEHFYSSAQYILGWVGFLRTAQVAR